jgi:hypothetical protein
MQRNFEILIDELVNDEEFRRFPPQPPHDAARVRLGPPAQRERSGRFDRGRSLGLGQSR